jgi:transposase-like protein
VLKSSKKKENHMNTDALLARMQQADSKKAGALLREALQTKVREAIVDIMAEEVDALCGPKHAPKTGTPYVRGGTSPATVRVGGKQMEVRRPRVRKSLGDSSAEAHLASWKAAKDPEEWEQALYRATLCGVSTRCAKRMHESELKGLSKSAVSRIWVERSRQLFDDMQKADLSELNIVVLMLDGIFLCRDLCCVAAIGIDDAGSKHVLGFKIGSSENSEVSRGLVSSLRQRGLRPMPGARFLAVLDGSDPLRNAVMELYPDTLVQRCLVHKERNIRGYISKKHYGELAGLFGKLRKAQGKEAALERLADIEAFLSDKSQEARNSLREAGEDLLRLFELEVPSTLNRSLLSTNCIENAFLNLRRHIARVCRWQNDTDQANRWIASGLRLAEATFNRIQGCKDLPKLIAALSNGSSGDKKLAA